MHKETVTRGEQTDTVELLGCYDMKMRYTITTYNVRKTLLEPV